MCRRGSANAFGASTGPDVIAGGTMAAFASGLLRRLVRSGDALEVRVLVKLSANRCVAGSTDPAADEIIRDLRMQDDCTE